MNWGSPEFILLLIAISTGGWLVNNWIRARHGYALEDEWGGKTGREDRNVDALKQENAALRDTLKAFEERVIVLERIATDRSARLASAIEDLREPPVPAATIKDEVKS